MTSEHKRRSPCCADEARRYLGVHTPAAAMAELRAEIVGLDELTRTVSGAPRGPVLGATHNTLLTVLEAIDRRAAYLAGVGA